MAEKANNKEWQPSQSANEMRHDAVTATGSAANNCSFFNLILFRGVAQLVARDVWELVTVSPSAFRKSEEMRSKSEKTRAFETLKNRQKRFDHNFDQN